MAIKLGGNIDKLMLNDAYVKRAYLGSTLVFQGYPDIPTSIQAEYIEDSINNYVFDGGLTSYFTEQSATLLDGVVSQTWVIRMRILGNGTQRGILGTENCIRCLKWEIDADDDKMDTEFWESTGAQAVVNFDFVNDGLWHTYFLMYDTVNGTTLYSDNTLSRNNTGIAFTSRINGRSLAIGGASIGGTPGYFNGQMANIQLYNKELNATERGNLVTDINNTTTGLVANFADNKTSTIWTDEVSGYVLTNKGGVTAN